ncbi:MAG TPA: hypothetical protein VFQ35_20915, partial [Polyangiaceae bacterium]|nr:hypothetical protein [Polyangiaceae bacterium]
MTILPAPPRKASVFRVAVEPSSTALARAEGALELLEPGTFAAMSLVDKFTFEKRGARGVSDSHYAFAL